MSTRTSSVRVSDISVADQLAYDRLPEGIKLLCEKQIALRECDRDDAYDRGYDAGEGIARRGAEEEYRRGLADGRREAEAARQGIAPKDGTTGGPAAGAA